MMVEHLYKNLPEDTEVSVICGTNERLQKKLDRKYQDADQIHVAGYTKQMSLYMDSADLCLMKPGGLSVTEAAVKKLPMAFINAVAGCEQYNIEYFVKKGGAVSGRTYGSMHPAPAVGKKIERNGECAPRIQTGRGGETDF